VLEDFYAGYHKTKQYLSKLESKLRRAKNRVARLRRYSHGKKFLDIGCNVGFAVEGARQLGYDAQGIDIDGEAICVARDTFNHCGFNSPAPWGERWLKASSVVNTPLLAAGRFINGYRLLLPRTFLRDSSF
jgi:ribosomal protein L11 methylase PrmA